MHLESEQTTLPFSRVIHHITYGEIKRGKSFGIHVFDETIHQIEELVKPANEKGIWEAKLSMRHPKTNNWVKKAKSSTLFPISWDDEILHSKLLEAFTQASVETSYKKVGKTSCGIEIVFIYQQGEITACYPLY